jgi:uncharacterized repeat protein (TIGR01451 family)
MRERGAWLVLGLIILATVLWILFRPSPASALPDYAAKTGQPCATCHVNPAGGGARNATGQAFEAIPTHSTDPAGAFAQATGAKPAAAPAVVPVVAGPVTVSLSGAISGDSVVYSIVLRNSSDKPVTNLYVAGSIPIGAQFGSATSTPAGAGFFNTAGGAASWLVGSIPAKGATGPFVYIVSQGTATALGANAFVHWIGPSEGSAVSGWTQPISDAERLAIDQAINNKLNTSDSSLLLWSLVPGTGPRMVDFARDINLAWFAGQAQNWTMALYEIDDQFPSNISKLKLRNATLAPALSNFQTTAVQPVVDAIKAKDLGAFTAAYDKMIAACNSCHAGRDDSASIKIIRPTAPIIPEISFNLN